MDKKVYIIKNIQIVQKSAIIIILLTSYLKRGLYLQHPETTHNIDRANTKSKI